MVMGITMEETKLSSNLKEMLEDVEKIELNVKFKDGNKISMKSGAMKKQNKLMTSISAKSPDELIVLLYTSMWLSNSLKKRMMEIS